MKKDIAIPEVKNIHVAVVLEQHKEFKTMDWNAYIINDKNVAIDTVLIVSQGYGESKTTSIMRHRLKVLPAKSFAKIEFLEKGVLELHNKFSVSYFEEGTMFHKEFLFDKNSIQKKNRVEIPLMKEEGILAI